MVDTVLTAGLLARAYAPDICLPTRNNAPGSGMAPDTSTTRTSGNPLTVAGAATVLAPFGSSSPCSLLIPSGVIPQGTIDSHLGDADGQRQARSGRIAKRMPVIFSGVPMASAYSCRGELKKERSQGHMARHAVKRTLTTAVLNGTKCS
jgi:hypothetical protein